jgi:uncharacterized BrkB/YihY/UPF0761 family membrane protein
MLGPVASERRSRTEALAEHTASARRHARRLPGASLVVEVVESEARLGGVLIEAGVAFRLFLWLVPFGLVVAAILSFWSHLDPTALEHEARRFGVSAVAAHAGAKAVEDNDRGVALLLIVGVPMLFWFTLGAIRALNLAYALAWAVRPPRIRRPLRAIVLFNAVFVAAVVMSSAVAWLRAQIGARAIFGSLVTTVLMIGLALLAMWFLPHGEARVRDLLPGAILVGVGYQILSVAVLFWFAPRLGRAEETYGAFGTAATLLLWLYVLARLVIGGAFLNAVLCDRRADRSAPGAAS